ncbi:efflux RND transporter periplasmic adaptor subunit [Bacteroidota bacterium]
MKLILYEDVIIEIPLSNQRIMRMIKNILIVAAVIVTVIIVLWQFVLVESLPPEIIVKPVIDDFKITVKSTGELQAKNSIDIRGPGSARSVNIWRMTISKLIDEGTVVDSGEFVAELDKAEISEKMKEKQLSVEQLQSQYLQAKLDSSLELSSARDELENLKYEMEEKKLLQEQSKYEPPATIRQAQINYEKVKRAGEHAQKNYKTKVKKSIAKISVVSADLQKQQQGLEKLMRTLDEFTIFAPASGMVIYEREWDGRSRIVGSQISAWDPVVATLPDLTSMESITYINEVDIQKINVSQIVNIGLDANPDKKLSGKVVKVANIGEQRRNSDSKVFQVKIEIKESDTTLLPSMTTSNEIIINTIKNVMYLPLECIHSEEIDKKKITFVYKKNNGTCVKQEVLLGLMNENEAIIKQGITDEDEILLSIPENNEQMPIKRIKKDKEKPKKNLKKKEK